MFIVHKGEIIVKAPIFALAAGLIAMSASAASALPVAAKPGTHAVAIEHVAYTKKVIVKKNYGMKHNNRMRHRDNDRRYDRYRGWNRYSHRPSRWQNRGCVAVGPIWFCP